MPQPPAQPPHCYSRADEVAAAEQSGHSTPETVVPTWAYSGRIRGPRTRSQSLVYLPLVLPSPLTQPPNIPSPRYGPLSSSLRPQLSFPQPPPYDRPTSTDNYPFTDISPKRRRRATAQEIYPVRSWKIQASISHARHPASPSRGPQPSSSRCRGRGNPFAPTPGITQRAFLVPSFHKSFGHRHGSRYPCP